MSRLRRTGCVFVLIAYATCTETPRPGQVWRGSIDTLTGGVLHVSNPEHGTWPDDEHWQLVRELRIGSATGDRPDGFGEVAAVGVSPAGLIHVIDRRANPRPARRRRGRVEGSRVT